MINFSEREKLAEQYGLWRKENRAADYPLSVITFLQSRGLLNEDKVWQYLHGSLRGSRLRDYTEIPGYEDMPNLTARYNYLHDLLEKFQHVQAYRCTRPEALTHRCQDCPLWVALDHIGARATCCNWAAESKPDEAIRVLERLLSEETPHPSPAATPSPRGEGLKKEEDMRRSVNPYNEPERPTEPPKEKTYYCPVCGEENPARYFRSEFSREIVGRNHCIEKLDAAAWEADHAD